MIELERLQIDPIGRTVLHEGKLLQVGSRAFDILLTLASSAGRLVSKDELMRAVWQDSVVQENNLQVHLSTLRKALGGDRRLIVTIPGRGYQLLMRPVTVEAPANVSPRRVDRSVPSSESSVTGRDAIVQRLRRLLEETKVLTLAGAGGIGKTTLAIEVARQAAADYPDGVCFSELAAATTDEAVLSEIAQACGLRPADIAIDIPRLAAALSGKRMLLVLDNAEHVIETVSRIVDTVVAQNDLLRVLVTSREPLRVMPEKVYRVEPLEVPAADATNDEILRCSAVSLFLGRVNLMQLEIGASRVELRLIAEICRRLDGIPLAIELAAASVSALGLDGVLSHLNDRMELLTGGYRNALPRHQTLRATFDWSFAILGHGNRLLFRRLAAFSGTFTLNALCAVVCGDDYPAADAINGICDLVAKSLVNLESDGRVIRYRLSESARAYALEKLAAEAERKLMAKRLASYLSRSRPARAIGNVAPDTDADAESQQWLDEARSVFDWAFSQRGDVQTGVELAPSLAETLLDAGLVHECCARVSQVIDALEALPPASVDPATERRVRAVLASALPYACGGTFSRRAPMSTAPSPIPRRRTA